MTRSKGCLPGRYVIVKFFHADGSASKVPKHNIYVDTQINSSIHHGKSWPLGWTYILITVYFWALHKKHVVFVQAMAMV